MSKDLAISNEFGTENITKLLVRMAPPVMLAQLIQALYNIVDSYFIGQYSDTGLTALSIMFPIQLIVSAIGSGTGVGIATLIARYNGMGDNRRAEAISRTGTGLALINWVLFSAFIMLFLQPYIGMSTASAAVRGDTAAYGYIVCFGSLPHLLDYTWTKVQHAKGNMKVPMLAQFAGAGINILLDPLLIWGVGIIPPLGVTGAAIATVLGQTAAAVITGIWSFRGLPSVTDVKENTTLIYKTAIPSITLQFMYTIYIAGLNLILATFSDGAVTILGLYYKVQSFFGIPIFGLQSCVLPILSYNYARQNWDRCKSAVKTSVLIAASLMGAGMAVFELFPRQLLQIFVNDTQMLEQGAVAFRIIALSFIPSVISLMMPIILQALNQNGKSLKIIILRHLFLFVPIAWLLSHFGLTYVWATFPITELITAGTAIVLYRKVVNTDMREHTL